MKQVLRVLLFAVVVSLCLAPSPILAQEWSAAQKDVWDNVQAYWEKLAQGDLEGFTAYFHPDYRGWGYNSPMPGDKATARKFLGHSFKTTKTLVYDIKPAEIRIHGNVAIVHYFFTDISKDAEGKEKSSSGRWTDILLKQGDRWVMVADHGGETSGKN